MNDEDRYRIIEAVIVVAVLAGLIIGSWLVKHV